MSNKQYLLIESALNFLDANRSTQPALHEVAEYIGLSDFHFQRLFTEWAGISPRQFLQFLNREHLKTLLDNAQSTLNATLDAGLSSISRTHDLFVRTEGMTPSQYRSQGKNLQIHYALHDSPFGEYVLGVTDKGVCHMAFVTGTKNDAELQIQQTWSEASVLESRMHTLPYHKRIFEEPDTTNALPLVLRGTPFQLKVWEALISLPEGVVCSYEQLAVLSGNASAVRASASAIARNRIAYLIPCHRVIRKIGESGEYRWGKQRKRLMLAWEASHQIIKAAPTDE